MEINNQQTLDMISITKIVFSEPNPKVEKTPIMILQEICTKLNVHTIYENISTEGQVHDPSFGYRVTCGNISMISKGNSKQKAKQAAALAMFNHIKVQKIVKSFEDYLYN